MKILINHLDPNDTSKWIEHRVSASHLEELDEYLDRYKQEHGIKQEHFLQMIRVG